LVVGALLAFFALGPFDSPASAAVSNQAVGTSGGIPGASISPIFTPEVQYWSARIVAWAAAAGVDPNLAATVMQMESCGDPMAHSSAGALGLFQVMPYHFVPGDDPYDPDTNALRGMDYLHRSLAAASGDPRLALAGYNGGIGVIGQPGITWAAQTQGYASRGSVIYQDAIRGVAASPHLLGAAGSSLCRQARRRLGLTP